MAFALDVGDRMGKNAPMPKWCLRAVCLFILLVVCWVVVHPDVDLEPTAFRFAVFAAIVMFVLRASFRFAHALPMPARAIFQPSKIPAERFLGAAVLPCAPLRC